MEHYLAAAEATAPDDPDLRAGAWGIGRGISALLAEDRSGRTPGVFPGPRRGPRPACTDPQPVRGPGAPAAGAGRRGRPGRDRCRLGWSSHRGALARAVVRCRTGSSQGRRRGCRRGHRRPERVRSTRETATPSSPRWPCGWSRKLPSGTTGEHRVSCCTAADATFTRLRLGRASAACRALLNAAGQPAPGGGRPTRACRPAGGRGCHRPRGRGAGPAGRPPLQPRDRRSGCSCRRAR